MNDEGNAQSKNLEEVRETFFGMLSEDVALSLARRESDDSQASRRDLIRTMFAAIDGYVWQYRGHVQSIVNNIEPLSPLLELALSETSYVVTESGKVETQIRFISLTSMIRLVTRTAEKHCPGLNVDFSQAGWSNLQQAIKVRNRITHPKSKVDLEITPTDIDTSLAGFLWLCELIVTVMESTNSAAAQYLTEFREVAEALTRSDPTAVATYKAVLSRSED